MASGYLLRELKIEVNRSCPLYCLHCSSNGRPSAPDRLNPHKVSELVREFAYLGGQKLCISGGEPLCYEELPMIIDTCQKLNIDTSLYTTGIVSNGSSPKPIPESMVNLLAESGIRTIFSLHGANANSHDMLTRVKGSFNSTMTAIEKVIDAGTSVEVHIVPMATNFHELPAMTQLVDAMNIHKINWLRFVPQGRGQLNKNILQLSRGQLGQLAKEKKKLQETYPTLMIRTGSPFNILCPQVPTPCEAGLSILTIRPDGSVAPCDAFKQFRQRDDKGNVLNHSLYEVWHKSHILNSVRSLYEAILNSSCVSCPLYSRCNSGCLAQKAIAIGRITDGRDPDCPLDGVEVAEDESKAVTVH